MIFLLGWACVEEIEGSGVCQILRQFNRVYVVQQHPIGRRTFQPLPLDPVPVDFTKFAVAVLVPRVPREGTVFFDIIAKLGFEAILILEGTEQAFWDSA